MWEAVNVTRTAPRQLQAIARFSAGPGREHQVAEAFGFELRTYFKRGVPEQPPAVSYADGVYTCRGPIITTHPHDPPAGEVDFTPDEPWDLDYCRLPARVAMLRAVYDRAGLPRFDGAEALPDRGGRGLQEGEQHPADGEDHHGPGQCALHGADRTRRPGPGR